MTVEQATEFLHRKSNDCKVSLEIAHLSSGPLIALCLARKNAIELWNALMGPENCAVSKQSAPTSLRALYGDVDDEAKNAVQGSQSDDDVRHELSFFFPNRKLRNMKMPFAIHFSSHFTLHLRCLVLLEPICTTDRINNYLCSIIYQPLTDALYEMTKSKPDDPLEWLAKFMMKHNSNKPVIHETNPKIMQHLMEMKEQEEIEKTQNDEETNAPAKCGCYLPMTDSIASSTSATATCGNVH